jgi:hypothetical protein
VGTGGGSAPAVALADAPASPPPAAPTLAAAAPPAAAPPAAAPAPVPADTVRPPDDAGTVHGTDGGRGIVDAATALDAGTAPRPSPAADAPPSPKARPSGEGPDPAAAAPAPAAPAPAAPAPAAPAPSPSPAGHQAPGLVFAEPRVVGDVDVAPLDDAIEKARPQLEKCRTLARAEIVMVQLHVGFGKLGLAAPAPDNKGDRGVATCVANRIRGAHPAWPKDQSGILFVEVTVAPRPPAR